MYIFLPNVPIFLLIMRVLKFKNLNRFSQKFSKKLFKTLQKQCYEFKIRLHDFYPKQF